MSTAGTKSIQINGVWIHGFRVMVSRYDGFCRLANLRFKAGASIAYKRKTELTPQQTQTIFGGGKVYDLTILWDNTNDAPVGTSGEIKAKPVSAKKFDYDAFTPTDFQLSILDTMLNKRSHVEIKAYAGTGKTATLVWLVYALLKAGKLPSRVVYLAYNSSIQEELSARLEGTGCPAMTTHAFGFRALKAVYGSQVQLDNRRYGDLFLQMLCDASNLPYDSKGFKTVRDSQDFKLRSAVLELTSYVQNWAICPIQRSNGWNFNKSQKAQALDLFNEYEIEIPLNDKNEPIAKPEQVVDMALALVARGLPKPDEKLTRISYDDMLYIPLAIHLPLEKFDLMFVDESQDFAQSQLLMLEKLSKN